MTQIDQILSSVSSVLPDLIGSRRNARVSKIVESEDFHFIVNSFLAEFGNKFDFPYGYYDCHVSDFLHLCVHLLRVISLNYSLAPSPNDN